MTEDYHISVEGAVTRVPGMIVTKLQEKNITYSPASALNSDLHPVRPGQKTYEDTPDENEEAETGEKTEEESVEKSKEGEDK